MINVVYGEDKVNLEFELQKLLSMHKDALVRHLYFDDNHQEIIDNVYQIDLFHNQQVFVIHDATFVFNNKFADKTLIKTLSESVDTIYLEIYTNKFLFNPLTSNMQIKKVSKFTNASKHELVNAILRKYQITFSSLVLQKQFEDMLLANPFLIENEIKKLVLSSENKIQENTIQNLISNSTENSVFQLIKHLLEKNKISLIRLYDSLISQKHQPLELMQIMAGQLFVMKLFKMATLQNMSTIQIERCLKIIKYVQMVNLPTIRKITLPEINAIINEFTLLDYNLKRGLISPYQGMKLTLTKTYGN